MTKLEELKAACDAAHDAWDAAYDTFAAAHAAYHDELEKTQENVKVVK